MENHGGRGYSGGITGQVALGEEDFILSDCYNYGSVLAEEWKEIYGAISGYCAAKKDGIKNNYYLDTLPVKGFLGEAEIANDEELAKAKTAEQFKSGEEACDTCIHVCPHMSSPRVKDYTAEQIMEQIAPDLPYIRGITVSGGECTLQRDFLAELFLLAKQQGLSTLIDSNGSYDFSQDAELMNVCDGVMLDVKAFDCDVHKKLTGMSNEQVLKNAVYLAEHGKLEEIRTVIVPDQLPNEDTVFQITKLLKPYLDKKQIRYKIIAYRQFGVRSPYNQIFRTPSFGEMMKYKRIAEDNGFENIILI